MHFARCVAESWWKNENIMEKSSNNLRCPIHFSDMDYDFMCFRIFIIRNDRRHWRLDGKNILYIARMGSD